MYSGVIWRPSCRRIIRWMWNPVSRRISRANCPVALPSTATTCPAASKADRNQSGARGQTWEKWRTAALRPSDRSWAAASRAEAFDRTPADQEQSRVGRAVVFWRDRFAFEPGRFSEPFFVHLDAHAQVFGQMAVRGVFVAVGHDQVFAPSGRSLGETPSSVRAYRWYGVSTSGADPPGLTVKPPSRSNGSTARYESDRNWSDRTKTGD